MLRIWSSAKSGCCDGMKRRDFLQVGGLGLAGLTLADQLRQQSQAAQSGKSSNKKSVIVYWLDGGPTQFETYAPKPEAPVEYRGPLGSIESNVPGIRLGELMVEHAKVMDKVSLIRSIHHNNGDHFAAAHWMITGYHGSNAANRDPQYPGLGAVVARMKGSNQPSLPAHVAVPYAASVGIRPGYHGGAYLGNSFHPFEAGGDPNNAKFSVPNLSLPSGMDVSRMDDRRALLNSFDKLKRKVDQSGVMQGMDTFNQQALEMITGPAAQKAFDINQEDPRLRDRYGRNTYGQSALMARRLVEAGVSFVTIHNGGWDHHSNIESGMKSRLPSMDQSIGTLIADLDERGLLQDTIVCVMGEFGRTPRVNGTGGRDHWGNSMSVLLGGGGLQGGQVIGTTNDKGEYPVEQPILPADILATIYRVLDVDLNASFVNNSGRPIPINNNGTPIHNLL